MKTENNVWHAFFFLTFKAIECCNRAWPICPVTYLLPLEKPPQLLLSYSCQSETLQIILRKTPMGLYAHHTHMSFRNIKGHPIIQKFIIKTPIRDQVKMNANCITI